MRPNSDSLLDSRSGTIILLRSEYTCLGRDFGHVQSSTSLLGFPCVSDSKESVCNAGDLGLMPGSKRSPKEGNGCPLQYS